MRWALPSSTWETSNVNQASTTNDFVEVSTTEDDLITRFVVEAPGGVIAISTGGIPQVMVSRSFSSSPNYSPDKTQVVDIKKATDLIAGLLLMRLRSKRFKDLSQEMQREGMAMLLEYHNSLASTEHTERNAYKNTIAYLQAADPSLKQALCKVLSLLVSCKN
jgi:hypothetical protein